MSAGTAIINTVEEFVELHDRLAGGPGMVADEIYLLGVTIDFPVTFRGVRFLKQVHFSGCRFRYPVRFERCRFIKRVSFYTSRFAFSLVLLDSRFRADLGNGPITIRNYTDAAQLPSPTYDQTHDFRGVRIAGDFRLRGVTSRSTISLMRARIGGTLDAGGLQVRRGCLLMHQIRVRGAVDLGTLTDEKRMRRACVQYGVVMPHAQISGPFRARGLWTGHLLASASRFGEVYIDSRSPSRTGTTTIPGWLWLSGSTIGQVLDFSGAEIGTADLHCMTIGTLLLAELDRDKGTNQLVWTVVRDLLHLGLSRVTGSVQLAGICAQRIEVLQTHCAELCMGPSTADNPFTAETTLRARVAQSLVVRQCTIANDLIVNASANDMLGEPPDSAPAWPVHRARIGEIDLAFTRVGGNLKIAEVEGPAQSGDNGGPRVTANKLEVGGDTTLEGSHFEHLNLEDAVIDGELRTDGTRIRKGLILNNAVVRGTVFAAEKPKEEVFPQVGGVLSLEGADVTQLFVRFGAGRPAKEDLVPAWIRMHGARVGSWKIAGSLPARPLVEADGAAIGGLDFRHATPLNEAPPSVRDKLRIVGQSLLGGAGLYLLIAHILRRDGVGLAAGLIVAFMLLVAVPTLVWAMGPHSPFRRRPRGRRAKALQERLHIVRFLNSTFFSRELYVSTEGRYRSGGDDVLADEIFLNRRMRESGLRGQGRGQPVPPPLAERLWRQFLAVTVGFGVRTHRLLYVWLAVSFITLVVFSEPRSVAPVPDSLPPQPAAWSLADSAFVTLRLHLPLVDHLARGDWTPSDRPITTYLPLQFESYATLVQLFSWIAVPLWLAGATGLLKKVQ